MIRLLVGAVGALAVVAALFATAIGLDSNATWGPSRRLLLAVGLLLGGMASIPPVIRFLVQEYGSPVRRRLLAPVEGILRETFGPAVGWIGRAIRPLARFAQRWGAQLRNLPLVGALVGSPVRMAWASTVVILSLAVVFDLWLATTGYWTRWPDTTSHFSLLSKGFLQGRLHLALEPSPGLLAAEDPYTLESRQFMPPVWDVSYFNGKFYLYWGPVPALLLAVPQFLLNQPIGDWVLVFLGTIGVSIAGSVLVFQLWRVYRESLPWWTVIPGVSLLAFGNPLPWLLSRPSVYEAAIASGQFFFVLGLLFALPILLTGNPKRMPLLGAGLAWGLAVGSRVTLLPAVVALCLVLSVFIFCVDRKRGGGGASSAASLLGPLILCGVLLAWYNWARFGDILEFGHRYQLGRWDKFHQYESVVSLRNAIPNIYNYFFNAPNSLSIFPYVKPGWGQYYIWPAHYYAPQNYHTEKLTGLLLTTPFLWLFPLGLYQAFKGGVGGWFAEIEGDLSWAGRLSLSGIVVLMATVSLLIFAPISLFVSASMRHLTDLAPALTILALLSFWQGYQASEIRGTQRHLWGLLALALALTSVMLSVLLAMTGFTGRFERLNPELFATLTRWFTP